MISAVNVALPAIQADLRMDAVQLSWIATAYLLAVAVTLVPVGKYADIHGRKKVFATGLVVYTLGSVLAAFAGSALALISLRVIQGVGAAMFITTGMAIITSIFPPQRRGKAIGMYVAAVYVRLSAGPFVGGFLTQQFGWRSIFALMLPLGVFSYFITRRYLKGEWLGEPGQQLDVKGCVLYATVILSLVYGASRLPFLPGIILVSAGLVLLLVFIFYQKRARFPVFEVELFTTNKTFAFSSLAALLNYSATFAITFMLSLYLQYIRAMSPQEAGTVLMAQPVMMALFSPLAGRLADRVEPRYIATLGIVVTVIGVGLFSTLQPDKPLYLIVANLVFLQSIHIVFALSALLCLTGVYFSWFRGKLLQETRV